MYNQLDKSSYCCLLDPLKYFLTPGKQENVNKKPSKNRKGAAFQNCKFGISPHLLSPLTNCQLL